MESQQSLQMQEANQATGSSLVRDVARRREEEKEGKGAPCQAPAADKKRKQDRPCEEGLIRTPSPEYADAVQGATTMGRTEEKGERRKVGVHVRQPGETLAGRCTSSKCRRLPLKAVVANDS